METKLHAFLQHDCNTVTALNQYSEEKGSTLIEMQQKLALRVLSSVSFVSKFAIQTRFPPQNDDDTIAHNMQLKTVP